MGRLAWAEVRLPKRECTVYLVNLLGFMFVLSFLGARIFDLVFFLFANPVFICELIFGLSYETTVVGD